MFSKFSKSARVAAVACTLFAFGTAVAGHHAGMEKDCDKSAKEEAAAVDIIDTAIDAGQFETLAAALQAADLVDTLKGDGPFTVFAPTDEAFAKLPEGTVAELLKPENRDQLVSILTYHVVPGSVSAAEVVKLDSATTVNGADIEIMVSDSGVQVDSANVIKTDIAASNGVIHVIDSVILPN